MVKFAIRTQRRLAELYLILLDCLSRLPGSGVIRFDEFLTGALPITHPQPTNQFSTVEPLKSLGEMRQPGSDPPSVVSFSSPNVYYLPGTNTPASD